MQRHLFISTFKVLVGMACFAAPWIIGNYFILQASLAKPNFDQLNAALSRDLTDTPVAIGDCTIFPLKHIPYSDLNVMGFGGSQVKEWYYLVKNNFDRLKKARVVVVGTNLPHRFQLLHTPYTSFLPYLMTWKDIYTYTFKEKRIDDEEALRFALAKVFNSYITSQTLRFVFFDKLLPKYRAWFDQRHKIISEAILLAKAKSHPGPQANPDADLDEYFKKLAELSEQMDNRLVYMMTPRSSWADDDKYKKDLAIWLANCKKLKVKCFSMGRSMPDSAFKKNSDGLHMNNPKDMRIFWNKFEEELRLSH